MAEAAHNGIPGDSLEGRRLVLGFDAGCMTCSGMARRVKRGVGDKLSVANLRDPELLSWRKEALGDDAKWTPTLFELEGGKVLRAWVGWRMGVALGRKLGPAATWQVMQALGETGKAPRSEPNTPEFSVLISRGKFLKGAAGAVVAASVLLGSPALLPRAASAAMEFVAGTDVQRQTARDIVKRSAAYKGLVELQEQVGATFDWTQAKIKISTDGDMGAVYVGSPHEKRSVGAFFYLDMFHERVFLYDHHILLPASSTNANIKRLHLLSYENGERIKPYHNVVIEVVATASGEENYVITEDGTRTLADQFIEERNAERDAKVAALQSGSTGTTEVTTAQASSVECQECKQNAIARCEVAAAIVCGLIGAGVGSLAAPILGTALGAFIGGVSCAITAGTSNGCENYANSASGGCLDECYDEPAESSWNGVCK